MGGQSTVPPGVKEREEATKVVPAREEATKAAPAMKAATGRFEAAAMKAVPAREEATKAATGRFEAAAMKAARRFAAANCRARAAGQLGGSRAGAPIRAARFAGA